MARSLHLYDILFKRNYFIKINRAESYVSNNISVYIKQHQLWYNIIEMTSKLFRVLIAVPLASAAGRKKLNGINRFLGEGHDWDIELIRSEMDFTPEFLAKAIQSSYDGILVSFPESQEARSIHSQNTIPTVFIDYPNASLAKALPHSVFIHDNAESVAKAAATHLLSCRGSRSYGFVPTRQSRKWSNERRNTYAAFMKRHGINVSVYGGDGEDRESLGAWLETLEKPAAVLAAYDDRARDVLETCRTKGINVPEEVSVLGIGNDEPICEMATPELSSIAVDFELEGYRAARELHAMMLRHIVPVKREILCGVKDVIIRSSTTAANDPNALVKRALTFIERHAREGISTTDVVNHLRVSRSLADLRFKEITGTSILETILTIRLDEVKRLLAKTDLPIAEIAVRCGYCDANYLKNLFKSRIGISMREFRKSSRKCL